MPWTAFDELTLIEGATLVWFSVSPSMQEVRFALTYYRRERQAVCTVFEVVGVQEVYWVRDLLAPGVRPNGKAIEMDYVRDERDTPRVEHWSRLSPQDRWFELRFYYGPFEIGMDGEPCMGIVGRGLSWSGGSPIDERAVSHIEQLPADLRTPHWMPLRP